MRVSWPNGHKFAFTIFDDTDWATVEKVRPVYDLLTDLGMRTTKSVWVLRCEGRAMNEGATCDDREYREWVMSLQNQGFEIGIHNVSPTTSTREETRRGLERFRELFGEEKIIHCNHLGCQENMYWYDARLTSWRRGLYRALTLRRPNGVSRGHVEGDPLFWGDLCREHISYVRNFVFDELNTLAVCPEMPYHNAFRPFVNYWFASANGSSLRRFLGNFTFANLDRLIEEGGLCIAYVHFAADFARDGQIDEEFRRRLEYVASHNGWFAPVSAVLDHLRGGGDCAARSISTTKLRKLETKWLADKILKGTS
jgi:hypothetical protein